MAGTDTLAVIAEQLALALDPLNAALSSSANFSAFMRTLGWDTSGYIAPVQNLGALATTLTSLVEDGLDPSQAAQAISQVVNLFSAVSQLSSASGLPATIDEGEFTSDFPGQLTDYLIAKYLLRNQPVLGAILQAFGIISQTQKPAAGKRPAYTRLDISWNNVGAVLSDPLNTLRSTYAWGSASFAQQLITDNLEALGLAFGLPVYPNPISATLKSTLTTGATSTTNLQNFTLRWQLLGNLLGKIHVGAGLDFYLLPPTAGATPGIAVLPYVVGAADTTISLTDELSLILKAQFDVSGGVLVSIRPNQPIQLQTGIFGGSPGTAAAFSATLQDAGTNGQKLILLGTDGGSRMEYGSLSLTTGVRTDAQAVSFYAEAALKDGAIVISPGADADSFISTLLPSSISVDASVTIGFDSRLGVYFSGSSGLEIALPAHISLGPIEIESASISVKPSGSGIPISLGATIDGNLGPLAATIDDVGLTVDLSFVKTGGNLGPVAAALAFKPPKGVGLSINAGVISGGGYLFIDTDRHEYAGALQLEVADFLSLTAVGLISTVMPDGSSGFSLLIIVTADFGPGIQLGFGFTLLAVGGLLGLNRMAVFQALTDGVRTGSIQSVMFPRDVIANAPQIISDLRAIFPPQLNTFLIGPMAKLGWGEPTLAILSLGVIIEIPPGDVAILGILQLALPAPDVAVLLLQVNFIGALEFDKQRFYFFASLFDSHVLFITLQGEMGVLFAYGDNANFVVSVGGFHPQFNPPPLPFPTPQRIAIDLINESFAKIHADAYFAVTTNTVQFGTHASYFFGFSACSVEGSSGFDALIQFSPFYFIADINTQFSVKVFGVGVYGIGIDVSLSGPTPWHVHGTASLSFFFFSVSIGIDFTWGDNPNTTLPPIPVMPIVTGEFQKKTNWKTALGSPASLLVALRQLDPAEASFILHPAGTLQISQRAIPLDLHLDKIGGQAPGDANEISVSLASPSLTKVQDLEESFAPSQFQNTDDARKLSEPAYAPQHGGIEVAGGSNYLSSTAITRILRYDLTVVDSAHEPPRRNKYFQTGGGFFRQFLRGNSASQSSLSTRFAAKTHPYTGSVTVNPELFTVALRSTNQAFAAESVGFTSQASARNYMAKVAAGNPALADQLHVLPHFEVAA
jgi:hypothetical protein